MRLFFDHPEQMTPGSFWKVRGEDALDYLNYEHDWDNFYYHGPITSVRASSSIQYLTGSSYFELEHTYFLVEFKEEKNGLLIAKFLLGEEIVTTELYRSFWDVAFELVHKTTDPKGPPRPKLLFGKYPVEPFREMIALKKKEEVGS